LPERFRIDILVEEKLDPVEQLGRRRLLLDARDLADLVEDLERLGDEPSFDAGEMNLDDGSHRLGVRKLDVVEEAAAEEGVRQLLLVVRCDDDDGPIARSYGLARLVDEELHAIELL